MTEQQLIQICQHIPLTSPQTIANNPWCFMQQHAPMPLVYQSFINEFTNPYILNIQYRIGLHNLCSEQCQSCLN